MNDESSLHIKARKAIRNVNIEALKKQFSGAKYRELVQDHVRRNSKGDLKESLSLSLYTATKALTEIEFKVAEKIVSQYNQKAFDASFWRRDCGEVFYEICECFGREMTSLGEKTDDRIKFNAFQIVTMNLALAAFEQKELRKFAGIKLCLLKR